MAKWSIKINPMSLKCSICLGTVSDPRILPCGHTFCGLKSPDKCLQKLDPANAGRIKCPNCQTDHQVKVADVPPDINCKEMLESLDSKKQRKRMCQKHGEKIVMRCKIDEEEVCVTCVTEDHCGHGMEKIHKQEHKRLSDFWTKENAKLEEKQLECRNRKDFFRKRAEYIAKQLLQEDSLDNQLRNLIRRRDAITRKLASDDFNPDDEDLMALREYMDQLEATTECQQEAFEDALERSQQLIELVDSRASTYCQNINTNSVPATPELTPAHSRRLTGASLNSTASERGSTSRRDLGRTLPEENANFATNILALGTEGKHYILELKTNRWEEWKGKRIDFECSFGAICYNEKVYIIGGMRHSEASSKVDIFHIRESKWTEGPRLNTPRFGAAACFVPSQKSIYICGGGKSGLIQDTLRSVEKLELDEKGSPVGAWKEVTPMQKQRMGCAAVAVGSRLFVTGGVDQYSKYLSSVEIFDSDKNEWNYGPQMREIRYNHAIEHYDGSIYAIGGRRKRDERIETCEKLDLQSVAWTPIDSMRVRRSHFGSAVAKDKIYVVGGYTKGQKKDDMKIVEIYDLGAQKWSRGLRLPTPLENTECVCW